MATESVLHNFGTRDRLQRPWGQYLPKTRLNRPPSGPPRLQTPAPKIPRGIPESRVYPGPKYNRGPRHCSNLQAESCKIFVARDPMISSGSGPWLSPPHGNSYGMATSTAPNPVSSQASGDDDFEHTGRTSLCRQALRCLPFEARPKSGFCKNRRYRRRLQLEEALPKIKVASGKSRCHRWPVLQ
jgi:hypothetical protein